MIDSRLEEEVGPKPAVMAANPTNKTMLSYFTKLPSKTCIVEEANPRRLAPNHNRQHVEMFQRDRLEQFDSLLYNNSKPPIDGQNGHSSLGNDIPSDRVSAEPATSNSSSNSYDKPSFNYIKCIKSGQLKPFRVKRKVRGPLRARLFQYSEDVRPAYFGTWQKKSSRISGRRPFCMDESIFDYEVDSEAEWDLGGPGESLKGDDSEDEEELDDYEIDMKTFVPHGYVSDDEIEAHSDDGNSSVNQTIEEVICDVDEGSNVSVKIVGEKRIKLTTISATAINSASVNLPQQAVGPVKQPKADIKPIVLGIQYENQQPSLISESKLHFLQTFRGLSCN